MGGIGRSLSTREDVRALIERGRPMIAGGERIEVVPVGGKGLPED